MTVTPTTKAAWKIVQLGPDTPPEKLQRAGEALNSAFEGSDLNLVITGGIEELGITRSVALVTTSALDLRAYVAEVDGEIVGVLCAKPKGFEHRKSPNAKGPHSARGDAIVAEHPEIQANLDELVRQVSVIKKQAYGENDVTDMWYISHLGIVPAWQGKGVGGALMENFMGTIKGERCSLLAVEPGLDKWYGRYGFKVLTDADVKFEGLPTVHFWAMAT